MASIEFTSIPQADVVLGGFPCQDFSVAGKRRGFGTKRGCLYLFMVDVVLHSKPSIFIAENVRGLLSISGAMEKIKQDFEEAGYRVDYRLLNASDYGIAQNRERVIIVGTLAGLDFKWPVLKKKKVAARQVLDDLETAAWDVATAHTWSKAKKSTGQGQKPIAADQPSITIRAEHHGNIEFHYNQERRLSVREAARLQSFPDSFQWVSNMSESYRQIGNAVPPVLGWHIAKSVAEALQ